MLKFPLFDRDSNWTYTIESHGVPLRASTYREGQICFKHALENTKHDLVYGFSLYFPPDMKPLSHNIVLVVNGSKLHAPQFSIDAFPLCALFDGIAFVEMQVEMPSDTIVNLLDLPFQVLYQSISLDDRTRKALLATEISYECGDAFVLDNQFHSFATYVTFLLDKQLRQLMVPHVGQKVVDHLVLTPLATKLTEIIIQWTRVHDLHYDSAHFNADLSMAFEHVIDFLPKFFTPGDVQALKIDLVSHLVH